MAGKGIEVAQAYVTIIPSMKDSQKTIAAELDADRIGSDAGNKMGEGITAGLSTKSVVIGSVIADAIGAVAGKAVELGRSIAGGVYEGFGANEQLVGGMEKLFGDSASTVIANADSAFLTAGKSANDYMENVTSFAATLVKSVGSDTERAAALADTAMQDMADNVNVFGTDAGLVENAIQGIAKGNYSMLDNLSLGFAGSQQGMMDLINASGVLDTALTDTSQLADVGFGTMLEAIHAVQEDMGITGTTAKEAMGTLEGSANAASSAWENVLAAIGTGDASQVEAAASGLVDTLFGTIDEDTNAREGGLVQNLTGLATRSLSALGAALPSIVDTALGAMPPDIGGPLREAFDTIGTTVQAVAPYVVSAIGAVVTAVGAIAPVVAPLLPIIASVMGAIKIVGVVTSIVGAISGAISAVVAFVASISGIPALIGVIVTALGGPVTAIAAVVAAIAAFLATNEGAREAIASAWEAIKAAVTNAVSSVASFVTTRWRALVSSVTSIFSAISRNVGNAFKLAKTVVMTTIASMVSSVVSRFNSLRSRVASIFNAVKTAIMRPINAARDAVSNAVSRIKSIINGAHLELPHFKLPHFRINGGKIPWGIGGKGTAPSISVDWYARGGYVDEATLFGAGEKGGELVWPGYAPYLDRYANAIADHMPGGGGVTVNLTYNGSGDPAELVNLLTRNLRMMHATGAI